MSRYGATTATWLGPPGPRPEDVALYCLPYAGGGVGVYREWRGRIPGVEVVPVHLPGRNGRIRERPYTSVDELVGDLATAMEPRLHRPFAVFGHSMGALLAFELTRQLRRRGLPRPRVLFASGAVAPQRRRRKEVASDPRELIMRIRDLGGPGLEALRNPELLRLVLPWLRADFQLVDGYVYQDQPPLDCPIHAFCGSRDPEVSGEDAEGWLAQTSAGGAVRVLPGDHFFLDESREALLAAVGGEIGAVSAAREA
ncbi:MAG: thioesterase [Chloroflexi bacterium]|nr:MAG: thioesterase [Chloroflexota bacterium]